ncbi:MAG: histidinol-phosphate transaminase [Casimicrobiaceae bacterium]
MNDRARADKLAAAQSIASLVRPEILAQKAYVVAPAAGMVKLDANESPHGLPVAAAARLAAALARVQLNRYPEGAADEVHATLRRVLAIPESLAVMLGNGSDELISLIVSLLARPGAVIMAPEPTFVMYRVSAINSGARFVGVPLRADFTLDGDAMLAAIARERPAAIFLASPNNPTGVQYSATEVEAILHAAPGLVVLDEAYAGFATTSFLPRVIDHPNLLLMATLSKVGMAGLRLGYAVAAPEWIAELDKLRPPYNVNSLTQAAVGALLADSAWIGEQAAAIGAQRRSLAEALAQLPGVEVFPSQANFLLVRVKDATRSFDDLKAKRILVKQLAGGHVLLANCLRITVGTPHENALLLRAMAERTQ